MAQAIISIDNYFKKYNLSRRQRRDFWKNFIDSEEFRKDFINKMRV